METQTTNNDNISITGISDDLIYSFDSFINYKMYNDTGYYKFNPSKLKEYNKFLINELSTTYKINKNIINIISKNIDSYLLNINDNIFKYINKNNGYLKFIKLQNNIINFDAISFSNLNKLLKYNNNVESNLNIITDYNDFINFIFYFYKNKYEILMNVFKSNLNKLTVINYKVNKIFNYVNFLKEKKNKDMVFDFIYKNKINKILIEHYDEVIVLDLRYKECIPYFFSKHDLRKVTFNHYNSKNNNVNSQDYALNAKIKKQPELSFIYKVMSYSIESIEKIKKAEITIDLLKNKLKDEYFLVDKFIDKINMIVSEIYNLKFNLDYYVDRQKIIHNYSKYLKTLFNDFKNKTNEELTLDVIYNLISNNNIIMFFLDIIKTETNKLIYL